MELLIGGGTQGGLVVAFLVAVGFVVFAGLKLGEYGDALGERTGIGKGLIGLIFLALVTSLPDLTVSVSAAIDASLKAVTAFGEEKVLILAKGADLAAGNLLGSDLFNLMIFVLIDLAQGEGALLKKLSRKHILSASCTIFLVGVLFFGFSIELNDIGAGTIIPYLECGVVMPMIAIGYIVSLIVIGRFENRDHGLDLNNEYIEDELPAAERFLQMSAFRFYTTLTFLSVIIVLSGIWLSVIGDQMSAPVASGGFGLSASFIGTIFLAIATSLPEVVVSYAAVRLGAIDMAVGNILGSNIFNIAGLFLVDCALRGGSLLSLMDKSLAVTMSMVILLSSVVIIGLLMRTKRAFLWMGVDVWLLIIIYILGNTCLYLMG